jgi:hypothetical protein
MFNGIYSLVQVNGLMRVIEQVYLVVAGNKMAETYAYQSYQ